MQGEIVRIVARDLLGLALSEADAAKLAGDLAGLRTHVQVIEGLPLSLLDEPFVAPAAAEAWLDGWPEARGERQ